MILQQWKTLKKFSEKNHLFSMIFHTSVKDGKLVDNLPDLSEMEGLIEIEIRRPRRTPKQNDSLHLWLTQYADYCQENSITAQMILSEKSDVPVTKSFLKDLIHHIAKRMYDEEHTSKLTTTELSIVAEVFQKAMSEKIHFFIPFPNKDETVKR